MKKKARLQLSNGSSYEGFAFGFEGNASGRLVCDSTMIGYTEVLTEPAYYGRLLVMTYPIIGNYGMPRQELWESPQITPLGVIVHDYTPDYSHWNAEHSLGEAMQKEQVVGLCGVDTHALTKELMREPNLTARIEMIGAEKDEDREPNGVLPASLALATKKAGEILLVDLGVRRSSLRLFEELGLTYTIALPDQAYDLTHFRALIVAGEGGGACSLTQAEQLLQEAITAELPIYVAAQGYDLLAEAIGAQLQPNKMIHNSLSEPIQRIGTPHCYVVPNSHTTSVNEETLPSSYQPLFSYLNGDENAGFSHANGKIVATTFVPNTSELSFLLEHITSLR